MRSMALLNSDHSAAVSPGWRAGPARRARARPRAQAHHVQAGELHDRLPVARQTEHGDMGEVKGDALRAKQSGGLEDQSKWSRNCARLDWSRLTSLAKYTEAIGQTWPQTLE